MNKRFRFQKSVFQSRFERSSKVKKERQIVPRPKVSEQNSWTLWIINQFLVLQPKICKFSATCRNEKYSDSNDFPSEKWNQISTFSQMEDVFCRIKPPGKKVNVLPILYNFYTYLKTWKQFSDLLFHKDTISWNDKIKQKLITVGETTL